MMAGPTKNSNKVSFRDPDKAARSLLILIAVIMVSLLIINILQDKDSNITQYPSLKFLISGVIVKDVDLKDLEGNIETHEIKFHDPMYKKEKSYKGFKVQDVLELGFGDEWKSSEFTDVVFEALDGYVSVSPVSKLKQSGGYIVFSDLDFEDWEPISIKEVTPGPFYLVWTGKEQTTANKYPWPWQLSSINLIRFEDQYSAVFPSGVSKNSSVYKGYEIFKGRCVRCHSMNGEGGKVGPDLNAPQSIVTYRNAYMIKEFIKNPSKYRYTQMPDYPDLSERDLDNLLAYFRYMNETREN
jgi:mono/diheme cytochrome c family protein